MAVAVRKKNLSHQAPLEVIEIEGSGATAQGSAVIAETEVPTPPHLIEGKSQPVTKNSDHTPSLYFGLKKCECDKCLQSLILILAYIETPRLIC